jgi:SAM-dependent methyltransferase
MIRDRLRRLRKRFAPKSSRPAPTPATDAVPARPPWAATEADVDRWNAEWLHYLSREWKVQLRPYTAYPSKPDLPGDPLGFLDLGFGDETKLSVYCDKEAVLDRRVMEMGCGCGNMAKLLGQYAALYLGTDYSTLALAVARLVSPASCVFVHVADEGGLAPYRGSIDTVVGRYFWIHQNLELGGYNLDLLERFLVPGGRLYADFYLRDPSAPQGVVLTPDRPLSRRYPSATFEYQEKDVERLIRGRPFRILRQQISPRMQRRYVVFEKTSG